MNGARFFKFLNLRAIALAALALAALPLAAADAPSPAGTWSWVVAGRDGNPSRTNTLVLKVEGDKLTGSLSTRTNNEPVEIKIQEGSLTGDQVVFRVGREINGATVLFTFTGKISGDTIKGKTDWVRDGAKSRDWEAKRTPAEAK